MFQAPWISSSPFHLALRQAAVTTGRFIAHLTENRPVFPFQGIVIQRFPHCQKDFHPSTKPKHPLVVVTGECQGHICQPVAAVAGNMGRDFGSIRAGDPFFMGTRVLDPGKCAAEPQDGGKRNMALRAQLHIPVALTRNPCSLMMCRVQILWN